MHAPGAHTGSHRSPCRYGGKCHDFSAAHRGRYRHPRAAKTPEEAAAASLEGGRTSSAATAAAAAPASSSTTSPAQAEPVEPQQQHLLFLSLLSSDPDCNFEVFRRHVCVRVLQLVHDNLGCCVRSAPDEAIDQDCLHVAVQVPAEARRRRHQDRCVWGS